MKITERQVMLLMATLKDTLNFGDKFFTYSQQDRVKLYDQVTNQMSNELTEIKDSGIKNESL